MNKTDKLKKVMDLIENLGLTNDDVYEYLSNKLHFYSNTNIKEGQVMEMLIEDLLSQKVEKNDDILVMIREENERGTELSQEVFRTLIDEEIIEIDENRMMMDDMMCDWTYEYFEYDYEEVIKTIRNISAKWNRDKKLNEILK